MTEVILIASVTQNISNNSFESGQSIGWTASGVFSNSGSNEGVSPQNGSFMELNPCVCTASLYTYPGNSLIVSASIPETQNSWTLNTLTSPGSNTGTQIYIKFACSFSSNLQSSPFTLDGTNVYFYSNKSSSNFNCFIDNIWNGQFYDSVVFNTSLSTSTAQAQSSWATSNAPSYVFQNAPTASGPWSTFATSTGTNSTVNQYLRYSSTYTFTNSDYSLGSLSSQSLVAASSGSFKSQIKNVGSINTWGNFSVQDILNDGNIVFSICSSTNSNMSAPLSCASQTPNSQITVSTGVTGTGIYTQWFATFTVTAATQTPTLQSGTVQWFTGSAQVPMASTVWDNRYWLSLTTTTADRANDAVLVLNSRGAWAPFDIHAGAFTQYKNSLYAADSLASGNIYLENQGFSDNGNAINAFIKTRELSMGDLASDDYLYAVYPEALIPETVQ